MLQMSTTDNKSDLMRTIESLREEMIRTGIKEGMSSNNTITISQKLDEYIAKYQSILLVEI